MFHWIIWPEFSTAQWLLLFRQNATLGHCLIACCCARMNGDRWYEHRPHALRCRVQVLHWIRNMPKGQPIWISFPELSKITTIGWNSPLLEGRVEFLCICIKCVISAIQHIMPIEKAFYQNSRLSYSQVVGWSFERRRWVKEQRNIHHLNTN